jgi:NTP pyrophosphatase (non-canonical NTP hydrolase)
VSGHDLAAEIISKHGTDRYQTLERQALKVAGELGELAEAILKGRSAAEIAKEYGDVGLSLYALGTKLGLNLDVCMADVVINETRTFT